jgi:4-amino-4-deoxy-L-arabinose transferase-like glycosyltransferase
MAHSTLSPPATDTAPVHRLPLPPERQVQAVGAPEVGLQCVLLVLALLPRALTFLGAQNLYGDAVVRTELAERWLRNPHLITAFGDGAYQFGPLQLYATALPLALGVPREDAGRWVSLLFGTLMVLPLYALTRRLFDRQAGVVAALAFSVWGMHLQMSTTAGSEALCTFLVVWALSLFAAGWEEGGLGALARAAWVLNLACATRYDAWMLVPLLTLLLFLQGRDRVAGLTRALFFGLLCLPFPLLWMHGNELAHGDPLYPVHFIDAYHRTWVLSEAGRYGALLYRLHNLLFWPGTALVTLSPLVALFGMVGMWHAFRREPQVRWLVWVTLVPTAYFSVRGGVLLTFAPLARFAVSQVVLLLPFVAVGAVHVLGRRASWVQWTGMGAAALLAVAMPVGLGLYTWKNDSARSVSLKPISPVSTNPEPIMQVARFLRTEVAPGDGVVALDESPAYRDVQLGFYSGLPDSRLVRLRWGRHFDWRLTRVVPDYVVLMKGGQLARRPDVVLEPGGLKLRGIAYEPLANSPPGVQVFRRASPGSPWPQRSGGG